MTAKPEDWRNQAECRGVSNPDVFFSSPGEAAQMCRRCPVVQECLTFALEHDVQGVWGGHLFASSIGHRIVKRRKLAAEAGLQPSKGEGMRSW